MISSRSVYKAAATTSRKRSSSSSSSFAPRLGLAARLAARGIASRRAMARRVCAEVPTASPQPISDRELAVSRCQHPLAKKMKGSPCLSK